MLWLHMSCSQMQSQINIGMGYWNGKLHYAQMTGNNVCVHKSYHINLSKCQSWSEGDHEELNNQLKPLQDCAVVNVDNHNNKTK